MREKRLLPKDVFTPGRPPTSVMYQPRQMSDGSGKSVAMESLFQQLLENSSSQVALLGESGIGKSALFAHSALQAQVTAHLHPCTSGDDLDSILGIFESEAVVGAESGRSGGASRAGLNFTRSKTTSTKPRQKQFAAMLLSEMRSKNLQVLLLENFHKIRDETVRGTVLETMEYLQEYGEGRAQLYVCGITGRLTESLRQADFGTQRRVTLFEVPGMSDAEILQFFARGLALLELSIDAELLVRMTSVACGFPYFAQNLGLAVADSVTSRGAQEVDLDALNAGLGKVRSDHFATEIARFKAATADSSARAQLLLALAADDARSTWSISEIAQLWAGEMNSTRSESSLRNDMTYFGELMRKEVDGQAHRWSFLGPITRICLRAIGEDTSMGQNRLPSDYTGQR